MAHIILKASSQPVAKSKRKHHDFTLIFIYEKKSLKQFKKKLDKYHGTFVVTINFIRKFEIFLFNVQI